jgi:hypothetical protein
MTITIVTAAVCFVGAVILAIIGFGIADAYRDWRHKLDYARSKGEDE